MDLYSLLQTNELSEIFKALPKLFIKKKFQNSKRRYSLLTCFVIFFFFFNINNWAPIVIPCQYFSSMFLDMIQNSTCLIPYFHYLLDLRFLL